MKGYLETVLHQKVSLEEYTDLSKIPLVYRRSFLFSIAHVQEQVFLLAVPLEDRNLSELRKCHKVFTRLTGYCVALGLKKLTSYARDCMLKEGIPFVLEGKMLYLPFLGVSLNTNQTREVEPCLEVSFLTQKLLLKALYESWQDVTVTQAAELLQVSKMSITRCFDEIQALELPYLNTQTRARKLSSSENKQEMWKELRPYLRNPVLKTFRLRETIEEALPVSGITALSEYSLLGEDGYPTYAVTKAQIRALGIAQRKQVPREEVPACMVQEVGYVLPFQDGKAIDPLSVILTLSETDKSDPRVELSINQMLEDYVW